LSCAWATAGSASAERSCTNSGSEASSSSEDCTSNPFPGNARSEALASGNPSRRSSACCSSAECIHG